MTILQTFINWNFRISLTNILNKQFWIFDLWHLVHFVCGIILMIILIKYSKKLDKEKGFLLFHQLIFLTFWESIEALFYLKLFTQLFFPETIGNVILDIIVGMIAGLIVLYFYRRKNART